MLYRSFQICQIICLKSRTSVGSVPELLQKVFTFTGVSVQNGRVVSCAFRTKLFDLGSGKTMLMDMFYEGVKIQEKQRYHFNEFMLSFHASKESGCFEISVIHDNIYGC